MTTYAISRWGADLVQTQEQLNTIFLRYLRSTVVNFGDSLPDADTLLDGSLFVITPSQDRYQLRSGAWVAL
jgi:hypothetical protein